MLAQRQIIIRYDGSIFLFLFKVLGMLKIVFLYPVTDVGKHNSPPQPHILPVRGIMPASGIQVIYVTHLTRTHISTS